MRGTHRILTYEGEENRDNTEPCALFAKALIVRADEVSHLWIITLAQVSGCEAIRVQFLRATRIVMLP